MLLFNVFILGQLIYFGTSNKNLFAFKASLVIFFYFLKNWFHDMSRNKLLSQFTANLFQCLAEVRNISSVLRLVTYHLVWFLFIMYESSSRSIDRANRLPGTVLFAITFQHKCLKISVHLTVLNNLASQLWFSSSFQLFFNLLLLFYTLYIWLNVH